MNVIAAAAATGAAAAFSLAALAAGPVSTIPPSPVASIPRPATPERTPLLRPTQATPASESRGAELYLRDCAWCHGSRVEGTARAPSLVGSGEAATRFYLTTGRMPIDSPDDAVRRRPPAYSPEEIRAIADHVTGLGGGPPAPTVDAAAGDVAHGGYLYRLHCGACHGATGAGFPLLRGQISPPMWYASLNEVAEAIRIGPGSMPVFSPETLTDEEVNSIVRYVSYLQDPEDPGGLNLFRVGPITEGAVAWVAGIGLLLLAARMLGERR